MIFARRVGGREEASEVVDLSRERDRKCPQFFDWSVFLEGNFRLAKIPWSTGDVIHGGQVACP